MRQSSSDDRIGVLERKVDAGFQQVDLRFERVDKRFEQVDQRFEQVDKRFEQVDRRFEQVDRRFEGLEGRMENGFRDLRVEMSTKFDRVEGRIDEINRTMLRLGGGALVTFAVGFAGLIATQL